MSCSSVLKMNARVRSPGCSASVTRSAVVRRTSRSPDINRASAVSSVTGSSSPGRSTVTAEICSLNSRPHAEPPETAFSARIFSSGSLSRWGR